MALSEISGNNEIQDGHQNLIISIARPLKRTNILYLYPYFWGAIPTVLHAFV